VAHFDDPSDGDPGRLLRRLQALLPGDVRVAALAVAPAGFHARHAALEKTYFYQLHLAAGGGGARAVQAAVPPHRRRTIHGVPDTLDLPAMRCAARALEGRRDFAALSKVMDPDRGTVRTLRRVRVLRVPGGLRVFATADGFLYGMARLLAGLLVEVGRGRRVPEEVGPWLDRARRTHGPPSLPAHALFLWQVRYAERADAAPRLLSLTGTGACPPADAGPPHPPARATDHRMTLRIDFTDRHDQHPPTVKAYAVEKAERLARFFSGVQHIEIVLDSQHDRHSAEMIVSATPNMRFIGHSAEDSVLASIDSVVDKLERQVVKAKERLKDHRRSQGRDDR
jgi:tRNA pseudouridine38-40 synthase